MGPRRYLVRPERQRDLEGVAVRQAPLHCDLVSSAVDRDPEMLPGIPEKSPRRSAVEEDALRPLLATARQRHGGVRGGQNFDPEAQLGSLDFQEQARAGGALRLALRLGQKPGAKRFEELVRGDFGARRTGRKGEDEQGDCGACGPSTGERWPTPTPGPEDQVPEDEDQPERHLSWILTFVMRVCLLTFRVVTEPEGVHATTARCRACTYRSEIFSSGRRRHRSSARWEAARLAKFGERCGRCSRSAPKVLIVCLARVSAPRRKTSSARPAAERSCRSPPTCPRWKDASRSSRTRSGRSMP